jgi:hypothetical protein
MEPGFFITLSYAPGSSGTETAAAPESSPLLLTSVGCLPLLGLVRVKAERSNDPALGLFERRQSEAKAVCRLLIARRRAIMVAGVA